MFSDYSYQKYYGISIVPKIRNKGRNFHFDLRYTLTRYVAKIFRKKLIWFANTNYELNNEIFHLKDWQETGCNLQATINSKFFGQKKQTAENLQRQEIRFFDLHSFSQVWSSYLPHRQYRKRFTSERFITYGVERINQHPAVNLSEELTFRF